MTEPLDFPIAFHNHTVIELWSYALHLEQRLDATFMALADPTRRAILARLVEGEASVGELAQPFAMSQPAISKHLKVLERAGLVSRGKDAQRRPVRAEPEPLAQATAWIERYRTILEANYTRLDALLERLQATQPPPDPPPARTGRPRKPRPTES